MSNKNEFIYTFIIPHHNSPKLLNRCIESIPQRSDIQIIVVDDNSRKELLPDIKRKDVEIIYIDALNTKGAGKARNEGVARAKGKWLLFADCDDYYNNGFIDILDKYSRVSNLDVLYFNFDYVDISLDKKLCYGNGILQNAITNFAGEKEMLEIIRFCNFTPWTKMVKREYANKHKMFFEEAINGNDILFSLFVGSYTNDILVDPHSIYTYVRTSGSLGVKKQDHKEVLCRFIHSIQYYLLIKELGYNPVKNVKSIIISLIHNIKQSKNFLLSLFYIFVNVKSIYNRSYDWLNLIQEHKG